MTQKNQKIDRIFKILKEELKNYFNPLVSQEKWDEIPKTPFTTLISCILSLRTKDEITDEASIKLLKEYNTPKEIIQLPDEKIQEIIYPVGFYKVKSKRIKNISKTLIEEYDGKVPKDFKELLKLKGVGRKTANIVMTYGFNQKKFLPIDTHCHRIPNRIGWINTSTAEETEKELKKILPQKYWHDFNHLFVKFGQNICLPVSPFCSKCPIEKYCEQKGVKKKR
ncbi:MAG: endonuclease III [Candidatus Thermoplasmatota archaeon]